MVVAQIHDEALVRVLVDPLSGVRVLSIPRTRQALLRLDPRGQSAATPLAQRKARLCAHPRRCRVSVRWIHPQHHDRASRRTHRWESQVAPCHLEPQHFPCETRVLRPQVQGPARFQDTPEHRQESSLVHSQELSEALCARWQGHLEPQRHQFHHQQHQHRQRSRSLRVRRWLHPRPPQLRRSLRAS